MAQISGVVVERFTRRPVRGVTVRIGHFVALTDAMGRFSIEAPLGPVQINLTHRNFHPYARALNVLRAADIGAISLSSKVIAF